LLSIVTEAVVDAASAYMERRQGIRVEVWWIDISPTKLMAMGCFMVMALGINLWIIADEPGVVDLDGLGGLGLNATGSNSTL
jgi:hypothetical protein